MYFVIVEQHLSPPPHFGGGVDEGEGESYISKSLPLDISYAVEVTSWLPFCSVLGSLYEILFVETWYLFFNEASK